MKCIERISKVGLFFIFILTVLITYSCRDDNKDYVPYVPVNLVLDLQADLSLLGNLDAAIIIPDAYGFGVLHFSSPGYPVINLGQLVHGNGIILYRIESNIFAAYDITCTYQASTEYCSLEMGNNWLIPRCPCCNSEFNLLLEGAPPVSGLAALPLKQYNAFIRSGKLYIKN